MGCPHYFGTAKFCTYKTDTNEQEVGQENLRGFARDIMKSWPLGDIEGGELQDLAIKYGLLKRKDPPPTEPCSDECACGYAYEFKDFADGIVECYQRTDLLNAL